MARCRGVASAWVGTGPAAARLRCCLPPTPAPAASLRLCCLTAPAALPRNHPCARPGQGQRATISLKALAEAFPSRPAGMIRAYVKDALGLAVRVSWLCCATVLRGCPRLRGRTALSSRWRRTAGVPTRAAPRRRHARAARGRH